MCLFCYIVESYLVLSSHPDFFSAALLLCQLFPVLHWNSPSKQNTYLLILFISEQFLNMPRPFLFVILPSGVPATPLSLALSANFMCLFCNIIQGIKDNIEWATCMKDPRRTPCNALSLIASCNLWLECWIYLNPGHACNLNFTLVHRDH